MVRALKAMENSAPRVAMGRGGSTPDCTSSAGMEEMVEKVAARDSNTPPSSIPSKISPISIGCLSSHIADLDSAEVSSSVDISSSFDLSASSFALSMPIPIR